VITKYLAEIDERGHLVACGSDNWKVLFVIACALALIATLMWSWCKVCEKFDSGWVLVQAGTVILIAIFGVAIGSFFVAAYLTTGSCS
jgi:hypothetical protein